jgi:hypothetical protein
MGYCVTFKLNDLQGSKAIYYYGDCSENYEGVFEIDLPNLREISGDFLLSEVVKIIKPCLSEHSGQQKANRAFIKIYKHFKDTDEYLTEGGFYS